MIFLSVNHFPSIKLLLTVALCKRKKKRFMFQIDSGMDAAIVTFKW